MIVTYHYIRDTNSEGVTGITPDEFREQVRALKARYRISSSSAEYLADPEGSALLTFDDGIRDHVETAAPILEDEGCRGVFFLPMQPYGHPRRWCASHLLHHLADVHGWQWLEAELMRDVERLYAYEKPDRARVKWLVNFANADAFESRLHRIAVGIPCSLWYGDVDQWSRLQAAGHELGGHGFSHRPYTTMSRAEIAQDMGHAQITMRNRFGGQPRALAYPFGAWTPEIESMAASAGYMACFDTKERTDAADLWEVLDSAHQPVLG